MIEPYSYQTDCLNALTQARRRGRRKALVVMASGLGKTITTAFDVQRWIRNHAKSRILYLCHQNDILAQAQQTFANVLGWQDRDGWFAFCHGSDKKRIFEAKMVFASLQTMYEYRAMFAPDTFSYVVVDESHHSHAATYKPTLEYFQPRFMLGVTATPDRMDFQDIRSIYGSEVFNLPLEDALAQRLLTRVDYRVVTDELTDLSVLETTIGKLSVKELNRTLFVPKRDEEIVRIVQGQMREISRPRVMVFCRSIDHCQRMANLMPGALSIHSKLSRSEQLRRLQSFRDGCSSVVLTVDKFNEGIDVPEANLIVFLRSTASETVFMQQLGRGLRKETNKRKVVVLDFVANCERLKMVHGLWQRVIDRDGGGVGENAIEVDIGKVDFTKVALRILDVLGAIRTGYTREVLVQQLRKLTAELRRVPGCRDVAKYSLMGKCASEKTFVEFFGSFNAALRAAGLAVGRMVGYTKADLIRQLQELALEKERTPKDEEIKAASVAKRRDSFGMKFASTGTYKRVFGSWQAALRAASLDETGKPDYTKADLILRLQALIDRLGHVPTVSEWARASRAGECPHFVTYVAHFGSRIAALKAAGLTSPNKMGCINDELIDQVKLLAAQLGRAPKRREFDSCSECASSRTVRSRFGSYEALLKAAGLHVNRVGYYSNEEIVQQLKQLHEELGRSLTVADIDEAAASGRCVSASVIRSPKQFGSTSAALKYAGVITETSKGGIIDEVRRLAVRLDSSPTVEEAIEAYEAGELSRHPSTMAGRFGGSWPKVLEAAGLSSSRRVFSDETLLEQFRALAAKLRRIPSRRDADAGSKEGLCASSPTYIERFKKWSTLVKKAGL